MRQLSKENWWHISAVHIAQMIGSGSYWQFANQQLAVGSCGWPAAVMARLASSCYGRIWWRVGFTAAGYYCVHMRVECAGLKIRYEELLIMILRMVYFNHTWFISTHDDAEGGI
jgi:hypothetical protein